MSYKETKPLGFLDSTVSYRKKEPVLCFSRHVEMGFYSILSSERKRMVPWTGCRYTEHIKGKLGAFLLIVSRGWEFASCKIGIVLENNLLRDDWVSATRALECQSVWVISDQQVTGLGNSRLSWQWGGATAFPKRAYQNKQGAWPNWIAFFILHDTDWKRESLKFVDWISSE